MTENTTTESTQENSEQKNVRFGLRALLILLLSGAVILSAGIVSVYEYSSMEKIIVRFARGGLEMLVTAGAQQIRGEDILKLNGKADYKSPAYARIYKILQGMYKSNYSKGIRENTIYVLKPATDGKSMTFAAHLPGDASRPLHLGRLESMANPAINYIGDRYQYTTIMRKLMNGSGHFASTEPYTDKHGEWISAYAPILTAEGRRVGILEADYPLAAVRRMALIEFLITLTVVFGSVILTLIVGIFLSGRITGPIAKVVQAVDRLAEGDFDTRVEIQRNDEIGMLARHFNSMAVSLKEKAQLSRYVSSDTIKKVQSGSDTGMRHSEHTVICCLFSDIRGFTSYSESHSVEKVVEVLNEILSRQTKVIQRHGGNVDKFVGDEMMATFEGDGMYERATWAALEIQSALISIREKEDLSVGIGLHAGVVIRGDIGALDRMDYTVIGSTVNTAARLCSLAKPEQVLVTDAYYLPMKEIFIGDYLGKTKFKGIPDKLRVYNISGDRVDIAPEEMKGSIRGTIES